MDEAQVHAIARIAARDVALKGVLLDVKHEGSVTIPKKKLLWLLGGRKNENAAAWSALLDVWSEIGEPRDSLYGTYEGPRITLIRGKPDQLATTWADDGKSEAGPVPEAQALAA